SPSSVRRRARTVRRRASASSSTSRSSAAPTRSWPKPDATSPAPSTEGAHPPTLHICAKKALPRPAGQRFSRICGEGWEPRSALRREPEGAERRDAQARRRRAAVPRELLGDHTAEVAHARAAVLLGVG